MRQQLRDGDADAFTTLYRAHVDRVYRLAASLCGDGSHAEDVTAETFLTAWKIRATIADSGDPLAPWLLAIAARQALNVVRGRRRQIGFVARHGHRFETATADIAEEVSTRLDDAELLARTRAALDRLERREVEVLVLCVWSGLSTRAAADALGVAEGTVRSRLSRARRRLRVLAGEEPTAPGHHRSPALSSRTTAPVRPTA